MESQDEQKVKTLSLQRDVKPQNPKVRVWCVHVCACLCSSINAANFPCDSNHRNKDFFLYIMQSNHNEKEPQKRKKAKQPESVFESIVIENTIVSSAVEK